MYKHIDPVFAKDISQEEQIKRYTEIAGEYEQDVSTTGYRAPEFTAEGITQRYQANRDKVVVLDIAAGTGLVAVELQKHGFQIFDALEPSSGMLEEAKKKNIYRNVFNCGLSAEPMSMETDSYDAITICGWHGNADPLSDALPEMIRVVKSGGTICIVTRSHYVDTLPDFKGRFLSLVDQLETEGKWKKIDVSRSKCYTFDNEGIRFTYEVC